MRNYYLFMLSVAVMFGCGTSKSVAPATDVEIIVPCQGVEYMTSADFFRANAMGISNNQQIASQKSMTSARATLAAAIESKVKTVTDQYVSSYENNQKEEARGRFQSLTREVTNQTLRGIRVICQKTMKTPEGMYKSYVAIELAGEEIAKAMNDRISKDDKLRTDFEYEKFKEVFDKEMQKEATK